MITDYIIDLIYKIFMFFLSGHEPLDFNIDINFVDTITDFLGFIFYVIPINGLAPIISIIVTITAFRILIAVIKTLWDLLPIL